MIVPATDDFVDPTSEAIAMTPDQLAQLVAIFGPIVIQTIQGMIPGAHWTSRVVKALKAPNSPSVRFSARRRLRTELASDGWRSLLNAAKGDREQLTELVARAIDLDPTEPLVDDVAGAIESNFAASLSEVDYRSVLDIRLRFLQETVDRQAEGRTGPLIQQVGAVEYAKMTGALARHRRIRLREAAGLDREVAAATFALNRPLPGSLVNLRPGQVAFVSAPIGTGKSDVLLDWLARSADAAVESDPLPLPVLIRGDELSGPLEEAVLQQLRTTDLGERGTDLVLDGVDETGSRAESLAERAMEFAARWPKSRIVLSSRTSDIPNGAIEVVVKPWKAADIKALMATVVHPGPAPQIDHWAAELKETIRRPLFAILAAQAPAGATAYGLIEALVRKSIRGHADAAHRDLAIAIARAEGPVDPREVRTISVGDFESARLVKTDQPTWRFELPIYQQWFAAQGVLSGEVPLTEYTADLESFAKWRYVLAVALSSGSSSKVDEILTGLSRWNPGSASWALREVKVGGLGGDEPIADTAPVVAKRLVLALGALALPDEPITNGEMDPSHVAIGVEVDGTGTVVVQWSERLQGEAAVVPFRSARIPIGARRWQSTQWGKPEMPGIWPWHWTLELLSKELQAALEKPHLLLPAGSIAVVEFCHRAWAEINGRRPMGDGDEIDRVLNWDGSGKRIPDRVNYNGLEIDRRTLETLDRDRKGWSRHGPWAHPDLAVPVTGWVGGNYSDEQLRLRTEQVYAAALEVYLDLAEGPFSAFGDLLAHRARLPGTFVGHVTPTGHMGPGIVSYFIPDGDRTAGLTASRVQIDLVEIEERYPTAAEQEAIETAYRTRHHNEPKIMMMLGGGYSISTLDVFGARPATNIAVKWLWRDLNSLGRVDLHYRDLR